MSRRILGTVLAAALLLPLAACVPGPAGGGGGAPGGDVTYGTDAGASSSATVTAEDGATIVAEGADGVTFSLEVPAGSVFEPTEISVTPMTDVAGGLGDSTIGVVLEPDGLDLMAPALLTIEGGPERDEKRLWFQAAHDGSGQEPVTLDLEGALIIHHFSLAGEAGVNDSDFDRAFGTAGGDLVMESERLVQKMLQEQRNEELAGRSEDPTETLKKVVEINERLDTEVFDPYIKQAATTPGRCSTSTEAMDIILRTEQERQLLSLPSIKTSVWELVANTYRDCEKQKIRECKQKKEPNVLVTFWKDFGKLAKMIGMITATASDAILQQAAERICKPQKYTASGGGNGMTASGTVDDITVAFGLDGSGDGFSIRMTYLPAGSQGDGWRSGTMTYQGEGAGFTLSGSSTYTIAGEEGGVLTLTQQGTGCVDSGCADGPEVITLTPVKP